VRRKFGVENFEVGGKNWGFYELRLVFFVSEGTRNPEGFFVRLGVFGV